MAENETIQKEIHRGPWIQTITGRKFYLQSPDYNDISLKDISHPLSMICRFNGHTKSFYSVAQHSVLVSIECEQRGGTAAEQFYALMHDAAEAYIGDIAAPLKNEMPDFELMEMRLMTVISKRFNIVRGDSWELIKQCDLAVRMVEKRDCLKHMVKWDTNYPADSKQRIDSMMLPAQAEVYFVERFNKLCHSEDVVIIGEHMSKIIYQHK